MSINDNNSPQADILFNRLIWEAVKNQPDEFKYPDEDILQKYIEGTADREQCELMHRWLVNSPQLRNTLIDIYDNLNQLDGTEGQELYERTPVPELPLIAKVTCHPSLSETISDRARKFIDSVLSLLNTRILIPAVAVLTVAVIMIIQFVPTTSLQYADRLETPAQFTSQITRGLETDDILTSFENPIEAVLYESKYWLYYEFDEGAFIFKQPVAVALDQPVKKLGIDLLDNQNNKVISTTVVIPARIDLEGDKPVEVWLLMVPSLEIWKKEIDSDRTEIHWPEKCPDKRGLLLVTYPTAEGYSATGGITFELK